MPELDAETIYLRLVEFINDQFVDAIPSEADELLAQAAQVIADEGE